MNRSLSIAQHMLLLSLIFWAIFSFISNSALALHHAFLLIPIFIINKKLFINPPKSSLMLLIFGFMAFVSVCLNYADLDKPLRNISKIKYEVFGAFLGMLSFYFRKYLKNYLVLIFSFFILSFSLANLYGVSKWVYQKFYLNILPDRLSGFFGMCMSYAYTAIIPIFLLVAILAFKQLRHGFVSYFKERVIFTFFFREKLLVFFLILSLIALFMCQTRGQILGVLVGIPVVFFFKNKKSFYILLITALFLIGLAAAYTYKFGNPNNRIFKSLNSVNHSQRLSQAKVGMRLFFENPLFGAGFRSLEERDSKVKEKYNIPDKDFVGHAHNNVIEILATTGLLGFVFFFLWIFFWIKEVLAIQNLGLRSFFIAIITGFLITGLFQSTFIDSEYSFSLFSLYGLSFVSLEFERFGES